MAGFLDFVNNIGTFIPGGASALPSWLAPLLTKKPGMDLDAALPYYQQMAQMGQAQNAAAQAREAEFLPRAIEFNNQAQRIGSQADLNEASDRGASNYQAAFGAQQGALKRTLAGVNPNSGAAGAAQGALRAAYAPGLVTAMNNARSGREDKGITARAQALPMLAPSWGGANLVGAAGAGMGGLAQNARSNYMADLAGTTKALKLPFDLQDEEDRKQESKKRWEDQMGILNKITSRFPSGGFNGENPNLMDGWVS